ncbi:hypothetical protein [Enterococcus faecalis]|nr:hypothetical protein [Enterococcus faecalis]
MLEEKTGQLFMVLVRVPKQNQIADIQNYHYPYGRRGKFIQYFLHGLPVGDDRTGEIWASLFLVWQYDVSGQTDRLGLSTKLWKLNS